MMRVWIGIDPGYKGAVAWITTDPADTAVRDVPTVEYVVRPGHKRREYDLGAMLALLHEALDAADGGDIKAALEAPAAMPSQNVSSTAKAARGGALWEGLLAALGIPTTIVSAAKWKKESEVSHVKATSLALARSEFPEVGRELQLAKHDGRAEALLIARWLRAQEVK